MWRHTANYFGLSEGQWDELFSAGGCGRAQTPQEAIAYIEGFIERHGGNRNFARELMARLPSEPIPEDAALS
jgi:hypothetical protein